MKINNVQFLSNMANVLLLLFIPVFAALFGASYVEIGLDRAYSGDLFCHNPFFVLYFSEGLLTFTTCVQ